MIKFIDITEKGFFSGRFCSYLQDGDFDLRFFFNEQPDGDKLFVLFPGAYDREKGIIQFQRYSWCKNIPGHVLIFDDPAINEMNDLSIGWFQKLGSEDNFNCIKKIVEKALEDLNVSFKHVIFFGSSAGGFCSLKMLEIMPDANAIVINPQVNVTNYVRSHLERLLSYKFPNFELEEAKSYALNNLVCSPDYSGSGKIFYFQNTFDIVHINKQLKFYLSSISPEVEVSEVTYNGDALPDLSKVNVIYYSDEIRKHSPPSKDMTLNLIKISCNHIK